MGGSYFYLYSTYTYSLLQSQPSWFLDPYLIYVTKVVSTRFNMLGAVRAQVHVLVAEHPPDPVFPPAVVVVLAKFLFIYW
jgi:hypothetical protein